MSHVSLLNGAGLVVAIGAALAGALVGGGAAARAPRSLAAAGETPPAARRVQLPSGEVGLEDRLGDIVPLRPYRRLVSTNLVTDRLFVELVEADRILAFSAAGARSSPWRHQYAGKATVEGLGAIEPIIAMRPDLVIMNTYGVSRMAPKLRAAGIQVFDLGELRGAASLFIAARTLGELLGAPERGARFADALERRLRAIAGPLGARPRRRGIYLVAIGTQLYGGTRGTSYHDILTSAGVVDVAASAHVDWPHYRAEQVVALAPEVVVTREGTAEALCAHPGLDRLTACRTAGLIFELPAALLDEPGPAILEAAELLFARAYPDVAAR